MIRSFVRKSTTPTLTNCGVIHIPFELIIKICHSLKNKDQSRKDNQVHVLSSPYEHKYTLFPITRWLKEFPFISGNCVYPSNHQLTDQTRRRPRWSWSSVRRRWTESWRSGRCGGAAWCWCFASARRSGPPCRCRWSGRRGSAGRRRWTRSSPRRTPEEEVRDQELGRSK